MAERNPRARKRGYHNGPRRKQGRPCYPVLASDSRRIVSRQEGEHLARENGIAFIETSAKDRINVDGAFQAIVESALEKIQNDKINPYEEVFLAEISHLA